MRHYNGYVFWLWDLNSQNCVLLIISKEYWFIKWLVENEKIDVEKVKINWLNYVNDEILENKILMRLSIQDEPIEFLVSILK